MTATTSSSPASAPLQDFVEAANPQAVAPRLEALRTAMAGAKVDAFLVPRADAHRGEAVPPGEERLAFISGFTGSAGMAIIGQKNAVLFVDGRYTLQAPAQTDTKKFSVRQAPIETSASWILKNLDDGAKVAYDPWLHTPGEIKVLGKAIKGHAKLVASKNLIDAIWSERPAPPTSTVSVFGGNRMGLSAPEKIASLRQTLLAQKADALVLSLPESICWLLNVRAGDVPNAPFMLGFAILPKRGLPTLFVAKDKLTKTNRAQFEGLARLKNVKKLLPALEKLGEAKKAVWIDPATCPAAIADSLRKSGAKLIEKRDPVLLPKAIKNDAEIAGMREAHRVDAIAFAKFLRWFDIEAPKGQLTEIDIVKKLENFRRDIEALVDISFETISGAGPNGAIVHYRVTEKTNRRLNAGELMLVDSGGQYLLNSDDNFFAGTTDITRTMFTGSVTAEQKTHFTAVLKGMIALSMVRFPQGTNGAQIDVLARQFLWNTGLNYNHGTGHGVGAYLSVHEGPAGIAPRYTAVPLQAGMVLSNEPGFYLEGQYGIRIENLVVINQSAVAENFLEFETLTLVPIDLRLIDAKTLSAAERDWLNAYHQRIRDEIGVSLEGEDRDWLENATKPI